MPAIDTPVAVARECFPSLQTGFIYLENAGGSQVPQCVIDAISHFMTESYVQTTAGYPASDRATEMASNAHKFSEMLVGAEGKGKVVLGASTTQLLTMLSESISHTIEPGDEIIISTANHEANIGPWLKLQRFGATVKFWGVDSKSGVQSLEDLESLLTQKTKLVAFPHTSNLLGNIADVQAITSLVHQKGAKVVVDGVAFAPHGLMEVAKWDVDFYVYSNYKVYGPHMAALYGKTEAWLALPGPNHFFISRDDLPYKFELGSLPYEGCAGIVALGDYFCKITGRDTCDRQTVIDATAQMRRWEAPLTQKLMGYLSTKQGVRVVGPLDSNRVPTIAFLSNKVSAPEVSAFVNGRGIGIRHGHMYSHRLTEALGVSTETGFVRVSAVHYNTVGEIEKLIESLDLVL